MQETSLDTEYLSGTSNVAALGPRFTGVISAICSALVINIILKSSTRLSSIYHRIMMGMSVGDIFGSLAMSLTTIPLPKNSFWVNQYDYKGSRFGNYGTCVAQAFFANLGTTVMLFYNMSLSIYYACILAFSMSEEKVKKNVEPFLHIIPSGIAVAMATQFFITDMYNPAQGCSWCSVSTLPYNCDESDTSPRCERGSRKVFEILQTEYTILFGIQIVTIFVCLSLACWKVSAFYMNVKRGLRTIETILEGNVENEYSKRMDTFRSMRATLIQSVSYFMALFITLTPALLSLWLPDSEKEIFYNFHMVVYPLQGFFNFLIFTGAKVYHHRRVDSTISFCKALCQILCSTSYENDAEAVVLSGILQSNFVNYREDTKEEEDVVSDGSRMPREFSRDNNSDKQHEREDSAWNDVSFQSKSTNLASYRSDVVSEISSKSRVGAEPDSNNLSSSSNSKSIASIGSKGFVKASNIQSLSSGESFESHPSRELTSWKDLSFSSRTTDRTTLKGKAEDSKHNQNNRS